MIDRLINFFKPRNVHYYRCTLRYYRKERGQLSSFASDFFEFQVREQNGVIDISDRRIKKWIAPDLIKKIPKHFLCNGEVKVVDVQYLGAFKAFPKQKAGASS